MLERVLVPLDGSLLSETALVTAAQISTPETRIIVMTVVPTLPLVAYGLPDMGAPVGEYQKTLDDFVADAKNYLHQAVLRPELENRHVDFAVEVGDPARCIVDQARKTHVDVIVMSTHGRSGLSRLVFGSVTNKVLQLTPCPILVVPNRHPEQNADRDKSEMHIG